MNTQLRNTNYRIGILGGMGPEAGVLLQQLIIQETPASKDQDHIQVICFTNPKVPDRTTSLMRDNGSAYVSEVIRSIRLLEQAECSVAVMACNTAYARIDAIRKETNIPIIDLTELAIREIKKRANKNTVVGILATEGTIQSGIYQNKLQENGLEFQVPTPNEQKLVMDVIYRIKAKKNSDDAIRDIRERCKAAKRAGSNILIFGCTELSLYSEQLLKSGYTVIDPLRIAARELVELAGYQPMKENIGMAQMAASEL